MKTPFLWALLMSVFLCFSCAGVKGSVPIPTGGQPEQTARTDGAEPSEPSLEAEFDRGYWVTRPSGAGITIIGMAGRRANRDEAVRNALADAAQKAALFHGVHAESAAVLNQGSGNLDYFSDFDYRITPANGYEGYLDVLDFDEDADVLEKNGVVIVRARYAGVDAVVPPYAVAVDDGVPDWTKTYTAAVPGWLAGVGHSKNKGSPQKTAQASYENALVSLLPQLSTRVGTEVVDVSGARLTLNVTHSEGDLTGVIILETWLDKKTSAVWTLVVAKAVNSSE